MKGDICLITGASSGLGEWLARHLIQEGWRVIGIARREDKLLKLQSELGSDSFLPFTCDVTQIQEVKQVSNTLKIQGLIPALFILNAGDGWLEDDNENITDLHHQTFAVNYYGALHWIEEWIKDAKDRRTDFIAISSLVAVSPTPGAAAYCASKAALKICFESLSLKYDATNIRFMVVLPGPIQTAMLKTQKPLPFTWTPEKAARYILKNLKRRKWVISFPFFWKLFFHVLRYLPKSIVVKILK